MIGASNGRRSETPVSYTHLLIDHRERSADVTAKTDVKVSAIDQKRFLYLVRNHPFFALEVMKIMADRLRKFDDML